MRNIIFIMFLCLALFFKSGWADSIPAPETIVVPDSELLFDSSGTVQEGWRLLLESELDNNSGAIKEHGLALLAQDDTRSCFILSHLGFLFEDCEQKPTRLLELMEALPPAQSPACQADMDELMMRLAARSLQVEKCERLAQKLGYIRQWALLGDINANGRTDLEKMWGVENKPDPKGLTVSVIARNWFYPTPPADGWLNLSNILTPNEGVVYALCYIRIAVPQDVLFTWELEGSGLVYLDGRMLFRVDPTRGQSSRICTATVKLAPGYHRLVVKSIPLPQWFARQGYDWGFRLKLTTPDYVAIDGLEIGTDFANEKAILPATPLKILPNPASTVKPATRSRFDSMLDGLTALAQGNLAEAVTIIGDLDQRLNHSATTSWLYAQTLLSHSEPTMRMQAATELSFAREEDGQKDCIRLQQNRIYLENQDYGKVLDELSIGDNQASNLMTLLGIAENKRGLAVQAEGHLRQAVADADGVAALELARLLLAEDNQTEAASIIQQAVSSDLNLRTQATDLYDTWINMMPGTANATLALCSRLAPYDLALEEALLESTLAASTLPCALAQARDMISNHPYAENGYRRLAELGIFTYEHDAGKKAALELAHMRPGNDWSGQYLEPTSSSRVQSIIDFSHEEELAAGTPSDPDSKVLFLLDEADYYVRDDYSFDEVIKRVLRLETDDVRDQYGEITLPDNADLLFASVITPDGEHHLASIIPDPSGSVVISFRGLETGCVIEYAWLTHYAKRRINNLPCFYFFAHGFSSTSYRLLHSRITVDAPREFPMHSLTARYPGTVTAKVAGGRRQTTWELKDLPRIIPEPDMPSAFYTGPVAQGSSLSNLDVINEWLWGEMAPLFLPDDQVAKRAKMITGEARTFEEKARMVFRYVDRNVERINGVILNPVQARQTLINHWGRGIDRAVLMIAMMRAVGVECYLALLNSSPDLPGEEAHPTLAYYDYALIYIPNPMGHEIWLDPNIPKIGFGLLLEGIIDKEVTVFMGNNYVKRRTNRENAEASLTDINCTLTLSPEGWAEGEGSIAWSGLDGLARSSLTDPHTREKDAQSIVQSYMEEATISEVGLEQLDEPDKPLICRFHITIPHLAFTSVKSLEVLSGVIKQNLCSQFISLPRRKYPMVIDRSFYQKNVYTVTLPEGSGVSPPSGNHQMSGAFGEYKLEWSSNGGKLMVQRMIKILPCTISPSSYQNFAEFCRSVDQTDLAPISIELE
jgi:hypothetical protein